MDSVFAALLAKSGNADAASVTDPTNPVQETGAQSAKDLMALLMPKRATDPANLLAQPQARRETRQQVWEAAKADKPATSDKTDTDASTALAALLHNDQTLMPDALVRLQAMVNHAAANNAPQSDLTALVATQSFAANPARPNPQDRNLVNALDRFIKFTGMPADRAAMLEAKQQQRPEADLTAMLPGVHDKRSFGTPDDILSKIGAKTDPTHLATAQITDKATAALTDLANQSMKHATSKEAVEARTLPQPPTGDGVQASDRNTQAGNDPSHRDQRQDQRPDQRQDQRPDQRSTSDIGKTAMDAAQTSAQTAATQTQNNTQNNAQTTFQNTVDAAQAALPSGGTQASTVTAALQVAPRAHSDAQTAQPDIGAIAVTIAAKSQSGSKRFDIRLDPPEMGRIDVRLSMDDSGKAQAMLSADNQQTLDLLQRDKSTLERALKDSGFDLGNNGLNFSLKGQDRQNSDASDSKSGRRLDVSAVPQLDRNDGLIQPHILPIDNTRLDIRV